MRLKVLVVDDEPSILRSTGLLLEDLGYEPVLLNRADLVVSLALRERPQIILQDARMPGLDLDRLVLDIRREPELRSVRIVLYTTSLEGEEMTSRLGLPLLEAPLRASDIGAALADAPFDVQPNTPFPRPDA